MLEKTRTLCGHKITPLGVGGAAFSFFYTGDKKEEELIPIVHECLKQGMNYIDTSYRYGEGQSERFLGKALQGVPRENYIISTKICRYNLDPRTMFDYSYERTIKEIDNSLGRLKLSYVDIIFGHDVELAPSVDYLIAETIPALQKIKESGKARFFGVSAYALEPLIEVVKRSPIKPDVVMSSCRYDLQDSDLKEHMDFFKEYNVDVINASPVAMGLITNPGPHPWHPASDELKQTAKDVAAMVRERGFNIAKLAVNYACSDERLSCTLSSMTTMEMVHENIAALDPLSEEEKICTEEAIEMFQKCPSRNWVGFEERDLLSKGMDVRKLPHPQKF